jgi:hypothetical protein
MDHFSKKKMVRSRFNFWNGSQIAVTGSLLRIIFCSGPPYQGWMCFEIRICCRDKFCCPVLTGLYFYSLWLLGFSYQFFIAFAGNYLMLLPGQNKYRLCLVQKPSSLQEVQKPVLGIREVFIQDPTSFSSRIRIQNFFKSRSLLVKKVACKVLVLVIVIQIRDPEKIHPGTGYYRYRYCTVTTF